jgi:hypothetical protein
MKTMGEYIQRHLPEWEEPKPITIFDTEGTGKNMMIYYWDHTMTPCCLPKMEFDRQFKQALEA